MERLKSVFERFYNENPNYGSLQFFDCETTGFAKDARIIEIGSIIVYFDGFDVHFDTFESLINPGELISDKINEITHITNDELRVAPGDEVYEKYASWSKQYKPKIIGAHNASFDKGKLTYNLERVGCSYVYELPEFVCTVQMSKKYLTKTKNDKLGTVAEYFNFENRSAHRALADAEVCAYIWAKIMLGEYE